MNKLDACIGGKLFPFTIVLRDPLGNSFISAPLGQCQVKVYVASGVVTNVYCDVYDVVQYSIVYGYMYAHILCYLLYAKATIILYLLCIGLYYTAIPMLLLPHTLYYSLLPPTPPPLSPTSLLLTRLVYRPRRRLWLNFTRFRPFL